MNTTSTQTLDAVTPDESSIPTTADVESIIQQHLGKSDGSLCIASSTGVVLGLPERIDQVRKQFEPMNCFWGAFVK